MHKAELTEYSGMLTEIGDQWRNFAYHAARVVKDRETDVVSYKDLSALLKNIGAQEKAFFTKLKEIRW
jgi:hypothetical protein